MSVKSSFDIDCNDLIPECQYQCNECVSEMESTFKKIKGVSDFYLEKEGELQLVIIEHEPQEVSIEQLMEVFRQLPTRFKGFFKPTLYKG